MSDVNLGDLKADWLEHSYASIVRKRIDTEIEIAASSLETACQQSQDPKVKAAHERLKTVKLFAALLKNGVT